MAGDAENTMLAQWRDTGAETGTLTQGPPPFFPEPPGDDGDGDRHGDDDGRPDPPLSNAWLGMLMFLGAETMFFAGLIGSFLVFRVANQTWPPPTLPSLPVGVTGINTGILLLSAITMWRAQRAIRTGQHQAGVCFLGYTIFLGVAFLSIQGYEWVRLLGYGLTVASGVYGATFYVLIGCHGLHVLGAVVWLLDRLVRTLRGHYTATQYMGLALCGMYWYYVVALWPVLYWLVYLY
jgi:heme/copper-type cytochrome/quinol oxidase subunit 3